MEVSTPPPFLGAHLQACVHAHPHTHTQNEVFLIIVEVSLMTEPMHMTIVTVSTFAMYMGLILVTRPFDEGIDLILDLVLGAISIFASVLSFVAETNEDEALPVWLKVGLYVVLGTQVFF